VSQSTSVAATPAGTLPAGTLPRSPAMATPEAAAPRRLDALSVAVREALAGTPGRMRVVALLAVVVTLGFGLGAGQAFRSASGALERAGADADQVVRVQDIHTNLVRADAAATNAFLVGGLEPAVQRTAYDQAVTAASGLIAGAARAQPADGAALAAVNTDLVRYAGGVEQARANNRQGLPVGAQYVTEASAALRAPGGALQQLELIAAADSARVPRELDAAKRALLWLVLPGLVALVVLAGAMLWMARRTHRYVNLPLAGATVAVLVGLVAGWVVLAGVSTRVDEVRTGPYAAALATAQARVAGFDAKAQESLTLIKRGSGSSFETRWQQLDTQVRSHSDEARDITGADLGWADYARAHVALRRLDDGGQWEQAVAAATAPGGTSPASTDRPFSAFDRATQQLLQSTSGDALARLAAPGGWLVLAGALGLLLGLLAAAASWWGVSQRLQEYR
jgi:hypothetical protein